MEQGFQAYYADVKKNRARLNLELITGKHPGQLTDFEKFTDEDSGEEKKRARHVYMTAIDSRLHGTTALAKTREGDLIPSVHLMTVAHAAYKIADQTHRVSTKEEIEGYLKHQQNEKRYHAEKDFQAQMQRNVNTVPYEVIREAFTPPKPPAK